MSSSRELSYVITRGFISASHSPQRAARSFSRQPPLIVPAAWPSSLMTARAPARRYVEPLVATIVATMPRFMRFAASMMRSISCIPVPLTSCRARLRRAESPPAKSAARRSRALQGVRLCREAAGEGQNA